MYKCGLKLWSTNVGAYISEARRLADAGKISYVELFVVPDTLEFLPKWRALGLPYAIHCAHSMLGFNLADAALEESNKRIYLQTREYADALGADSIIFHGGTGGDIRETARQLAAFGESRALLENKPYRALRNKLGSGFCRGYCAGEIKAVMDASGCGFCLDFGHAVCAANSLGREPYEYCAELLALNPSMFHLTDLEDVNSEFDSHPHFGDGTLDLKKIAAMIRPGARVTVETVKLSKDSLADFERDAECLAALS